MRPTSRAERPLRDPEEPVTISASALTTLEECPARWFFEREAGGAAASHQSANLGQVVHALAERVGRGDVVADPDDPEGEGALVTELMGQGVNGVTGDYSRGAGGFRVENGEIQYPVDGVTIAGNLREMFSSIEAVGSDVDPRSHIRTGSILLRRMTVAGND